MEKRMQSVSRAASNNNVSRSIAEHETVMDAVGPGCAFEAAVIHFSATPSNIFRPGDTVRGTVTFEVRKSTLVRCLRIKCVGRERVRLQRDDDDNDDGDNDNKRSKSGGSSSRYKTQAMSSTIFFKHVLTVAGVSLEDEKRLLGSLFVPKDMFVSNRYSFPFAFELPSKLPPSCNWSSSGGVQASSADDGGDVGKPACHTAYAHIRYEIKCYADIAAPRSREFVARRLFSVATPISGLQHRFLLSDNALGRSTSVSQWRQDPDRCCSCLCRYTMDGCVVLSAIVDPRVVVANQETSVQVYVDIENRTPTPVSALVVSWRNRMVVRTSRDTSSQRLKETCVATLRIASFKPVPAATRRRVAVEVPVFPVVASSTLATPPSMVSFHIRSKWFISVDIDDRDVTSLGEDCIAPVVVVQELDETNRTRPIDFVEADFETISKGMSIELRP